MSDRESRSGFGVVQQASVESTDSRLCYLTSSEVGTHIHIHYSVSYLLDGLLRTGSEMAVFWNCSETALKLAWDCPESCSESAQQLLWYWLTTASETAREMCRGLLWNWLCSAEWLSFALKLRLLLFTITLIPCHGRTFIFRVSSRHAEAQIVFTSS